MITLYSLTYVGGLVVVVAALVRAAAIPGVQWWAYVGYSMNTVIVVAYAYQVGESSIIFNQGILMLTNIIGLYRWWGK